MENLKKFIQEEIQKLHQVTLLENKKNQIERKLKLLSEGKEELIGYDVPNWAMSSLINGDDSGLEDEDIQKINDFVNSVVKAHGNANFLLGDIEGEDNLGFRPYNDIDNLGADVYRLYIRPDKETSFKDMPFNKRLQSGDYYIKETKDVKAMYRKAGMEPPHPGKGIHTKKFHKCVTSVGDEDGKNPYAICMSSLGKEKAVKASHRTDENMEYPVSDTKSKILSQAGEMPETGVDLRFNMHDEPYILKTLDNEEVNAWINAVKNMIPDILVYKHKSMKAKEPTLNEEHVYSLEKAAQDFIKNTLKLGTKENMFDAYMIKNGIGKDN